MTLASISLFSGAGGLDRGAHLVGGFKTVAYVEYDRYAQGVLMSRMRSGDLDDAPIFEDVRTFDGRSLKDYVDVVSGGFPCQDVSHAGKRAGLKDGTRSGLWSEFARIVREVEPRFVLVENVRGLLSIDDGRGFGRVLGDLAKLGFDAEWFVLSAADVGAPHLRERVFIVAWRRNLFITPPGVIWPTPSAGKVTQSGDLVNADGTPWDGASKPFSAKTGKPVQTALTDAVKARTKWPTPVTDPTRPSEGNVRILREKVRRGEVSEAEAEAMLNGKSVFEAQGKIPAAIEDEPTLWATPRVSRGGYTRDKGKKGNERLTLEGQAQKWPTPTSRDGKGSDAPNRGGGNRSVKPFGLFPTPRVGGVDGGSNSRKAAKKRGMWPTTPNEKET